MQINPQEFQRSITKEICDIYNRVRFLIASANYPEEGRYKEAVLRNVLKRFLPANIGLGTGFVIDKEETQPPVITRQIDIIVYDKQYPLLFSEGDFIITTPANVKGIIEVKTRLDREIRETITNATENGNLINGVLGREIFNGVFSFEELNTSIPNLILSECLETSNGVVNHLCIGKDIFIKYWSPPPLNSLYQRQYTTYEIENYSFTYFISNLLEHLSNDPLLERWWFMYPIEGGKEGHRIAQMELPDNQ